MDILRSCFFFSRLIPVYFIVDHFCRIFEFAKGIKPVAGLRQPGPLKRAEIKN